MENEKNTNEEKCLECSIKHVNKHTFLCNKCYHDELFFLPRFDLINQKKLLSEDRLKRFNDAPYYLKRFLVQECIKKGVMV